MGQPVAKLLAQNDMGAYINTGNFANVAEYINMNYEGLKDDIVSMLGGGRCKVDCTSFGNNPAIINNKDEVLRCLSILDIWHTMKTKNGVIFPTKRLLENFTEDILLVGIDYDKETKKHRCEIEKALSL